MTLKLAVRAGLVSFIIKNNVAIVEKKPIRVSAGCKFRRIGWWSDFLVRGGVRLLPVDEWTKIENKTYHVVAKRELKYATIMALDKMITVTEVKFENPLVYRTGYLVFDIRGNDARLIDAEPTHLLFVDEYAAYFRRARIIVNPGNTVVFNDWVACGQKSIAMVVAFIPVNSLFTVCYNASTDRYACREIIATVPPAVKREFFTAEVPGSS